MIQYSAITVWMLKKHRKGGAVKIRIEFLKSVNIRFYPNNYKRRFGK